MRLQLLMAAALALGVISALSFVRARAGQDAGATTGPNVPAIVVDASRKMAVLNGDPHPALAEYVTTGRQAANGFDSDERVDSDIQVYFVIMRGHFVDTKPFAPSGAPNPSGNQLEITIDPATGSVLDLGILHRPSPPSQARLSHLGEVHDITTLVQGGP